MALLAACGGSSTGGSASNPIVGAPTVLSVFGDNAGIARVSVTDSGATIVANVMAADIQNYNANPSAAIDISAVSYLGSNAYGSSYGGNTTVNGTPVYMWIYQDNSSQVTIGYGQSATTNLAYAGGYQVSSIPSGSYNYTGTNIIGLRDGSYFEAGTFSMNVNFSAGTASLTGSTPYSTIGGTNINVNNSAGTFSSDNLTLTVNDGVNNLNVPAAIRGNFHGSGAVGVSGLYYDTNSSTPVGAGAIAGTR